MAEFVDQIPQQPGLEFEEKKHQYVLNGTQVLPSVTTLMKPLSDTLYAGIRPETLQAAAERGTEVHSAIEDYVTLGITDISEARRGYFEAFLRWMKDYNVQPLSVEHRAWVCGVERVPTEEKAAPAGKDDDAVDAEFHEVEENSENCAADNNSGEEAEDSDEAPEE